MRILITGAGGMLGHDVIAAARAAGHEPVGVDLEVDITDRAAIGEHVARVAPDAIINCAAWTNVDSAEEHVAEALAVNGAGAGNVAAAAAQAGAWVIQVSTDYVFDGDKREPYLESDPVGPISSYGRSKLDGEQAVMREAPESHTIVRTAWLFGVHGHSFPATMLRLGRERDRITVVDDQVGSPTFTGHLAPALVGLAQQRMLGVLHVVAGEQCSWFDFARAIMAAAGADCAVEPISSAQYAFPTPRPAFSVLRSERGAPELPSWREGLAQFMELTGGEAAS